MKKGAKSYSLKAVDSRSVMELDYSKRIVRYLSDHPSKTQREIQRSLRITDTTTARYLRLLHDVGIITRKESDGKYLYMLTGFWQPRVSELLEGVQQRSAMY